MRRPRFVLLALALFAGAVWLPSAAEAEKVTIKMATLVPAGSSWHTTLQELAARWQELSGGRVTLRLYPGGVAGDDTDLVRKMRLGTLDAALLAPSGLAQIDREIHALLVPLAYRSYEEFDAVAEGLEPRLAAGFREKGFVVLSWADGGWVQFFAKSPVATPQDLAAQKLFSWSGDQATTELWKAAGFQPVPLPATEISTALQTGLVTAVATSAQAAVLLQWYEHAPYLTDLPWAVLVGGIVVSERSWEKVPAELRGPLAEAARETGRKLSAQTRESAPEHVAAMVRRGLTVVPVDAAGRAEWERRVVEAYPKLRDGFVPADAFTAALALRDAWRARDGKR
ncbi:MAG: 2,3-diketo-L-gulonate-binding periplasmic protein YiaO precursor [Acidobacteria bacterium ADurb.Bin051]|jgi:TRAP-type C4-dicarboxylate transport system substrate-binding protein|nr:MAG: 2,3-diketo-L-gulonate-binding periplasmic protein YiaO precursor [Acidobacteria bacterium ADurb.Bin051]